MEFSFSDLPHLTKEIANSSSKIHIVEIVPYLYIGDEKAISIEGEAEREETWGYSKNESIVLSDLENKGIKRIINCSNNIPCIFKEMLYKKFAFDTLNKTNMKDFQEFINMSISKKEGVIVVDDLGISKSASIIVAYLMLEFSWQYITALLFVRVKRAIINTTDYEEQLIQIQNDDGRNKKDNTSKRKEKEEDEMEESSPKKKKSKLNYYENDNFQSKLKQILSVCSQAARDAGELMKEHLGSSGVYQTKANKSDLVTVVDKKAQNLIEKKIQQYFPLMGILGEENVDAGREASKSAIDEFLSKFDWLCIIDPIDGTTNFINAIPLSVVSIGVSFKGLVHIAVIFDPYRNELFTSIRGQGAFMNGMKMNVSKVELDNSLVGVGIGSSKEAYTVEMKAQKELMNVCRSVRVLGSACLQLAWVALGRLDCFYELDLNSWDLAAGSLLVTESGGIVSDTRGGEYCLFTRDVIAANKLNYKPFMNVIKNADAQNLSF